MLRPDQPRVAVIVPCFNDGATLQEAVDSALSQNEEVEIVVVDDGSTDAQTVQVIEDLEAAGIGVVRQENSGLGLARMAGVAATGAPYVLPLDADDVLCPGAVRTLADELDARPDAAAAWGWYQRFGDETTVQPTTPRLDAWHITYQNELPATALIRREALLDTPGWRLAGGYEDWDLWMSLAETGWAGIGLDRVVYRYRRQSGRMSHQASDRHDEIVEKLRRLHGPLFAARLDNRRASSAPFVLKVVLPALERLPISGRRRGQLAGVSSHLAHRRGVGLLLRRVAEQHRRQT